MSTVDEGPGPKVNEATELRGIVTTGLGEGTHFMALDWVVDECRTRLGFTPCPGTFNLRMCGPHWSQARQRMRSSRGIGLTPAAGFCAARCFPVSIDGQLAATGIVPEVPDYPDDKLELIAAVNIREALDLTDGDTVYIRVNFECATSPGQWAPDHGGTHPHTHTIDRP